MNGDDVALGRLIEESNDLQFDALGHVRARGEEIRDIARTRSGHPHDGDRVRHVALERRRLLKAGGFGLALLAGRGLLLGPLGSAVSAIVRRPWSAHSDVEVQMFQTAASLESVAVGTYEAAIELPFVRENPLVLRFAETTMRQHLEHAAAFNARSVDLGGEPQNAPNPRYSSSILEAVPAASNAAAVIALAATLEEVVTDTYLANLTLLPDAAMRSLMASVMGVESQHLATLRVIGALLAAGLPELVALPTDVSALPAEALSVAFPQSFESPNLASPPAEGAVR